MKATVSESIEVLGNIHVSWTQIKQNKIRSFLQQLSIKILKHLENF